MKKLMICLAGIVLCQGLVLAQNGGQPSPTAYTLGFSSYLSHTDKYAARFYVYYRR